MAHETVLLSQRTAPILWALLGLFFLRVVGQVLVAIFNVSFLPPMEEWYSGLIPYPILLGVQILMILVMVKICLDFSRGHGFFVIQNTTSGRFLLWTSYLYFASMVLRYGITMAVYPERRWLGGTIPIWFHFVLAGFVFIVGRFYCRR